MKTLYLVFIILFCSVSVRSEDKAGDNSINSGNLSEISWKIVNLGSARCFVVNSKGIVFAGTWGILRSEDNGLHWTHIDLPNNTYEVNSMAISSNDFIFATTFDGKLYRSTIDGLNWTQISPNSTNLFFSCIDINSLDEIFVGTESGVLRSTDNGNSFQNTGWTSSVYKLIINNNNELFIASYGVYRSIDNGDSWLSTSSGMKNTGVNAFAFNSLGNIFAGTAAPDGGVFVSTDNGNNWTTTIYSFYGNPDSVVTALACNSANDIFIGTFSVGIVSLANGGNTLKAINQGLPAYRPIITSFAFTSDGYILAGTTENIYRSEQVAIGIKENPNSPLTFVLEQNIPNPFYDKTMIQYSIPKNAQTKISIFNQEGRLVKILINQIQSAGNYSIYWNASDALPGVYNYRIESGEYTITKKMVLLK